MACAPCSPSSPSASGCRARPSSATGRAPPRPRRGAGAGAGGAPRPRTSTAASPRTGPTATTCSSCSVGSAAALVRLAGPAAHRPAGPPVRRARPAGGAQEQAAPDAAGRRDVRARLRPPRAPGRAGAGRGPGGDHRHRAGAGSGRRTPARSWWRRARFGTAERRPRHEAPGAPRPAPGASRRHRELAARHPARAGPGVVARGGGGRARGFHVARGGARRRGHRGLRVVALGARAGAPLSAISSTV